MRTTYGSLPQFDALRKSEELSVIQDCLPYTFLFLFKENFYSIARKRYLDKPNTDLVFGACSIVAIKRSIGAIRDQNYSEIIYSEFVRNQTGRFNMDLYLHGLLETICLILEISFLDRIAVIKSNNSKISQSIHLTFLFLEDRLPKSNHVLDTEIPQNLHLETSIRLFRRQIKDVSLSHLLRIVFRKYKTLCGKIFQSWREKEHRSIDILLANLYIYEIDSLLLVLWRQMHESQPRYFASPDRNNIIRKEAHVSAYGSQLDAADVDCYLTRSLCIHYGRCRSKSFIAFEGTGYFAKKWIYYFLILLRSHFHYRTEFDEIHLKSLSNGCISFLSYTLTTQLVSKNVQIETTTGSYISISGDKKFYPKVPILLLVKLLAKDKFCDRTGHPVSKLAWAMLADDDILNRFVQIRKIVSLYHSASTNRDGLRRLRYILRLSCDSTLAVKHKSTIRLLRRRFDLELPKKFRLSRESGSDKNRRIWHLSLIRSVLLRFGTSKIGV
uniref:Maturase K n=1 Tax=Histiopteris incisa TaxID=32090 RepID=A0A3G5CUW1_9MONI|nr:maturase K [Histiopteris incisa]AYW16670.1 maturase K [Histiopteris incisa]